MARLIFLVVAIALVYWLLRRFRQPPSGTQDAPRTEDMVSCAHCGLNLPKSEALTSGDKFYCCEEHRRASQPE
ncbi:MAG: PP0621 family protein [Sideroxydans sp.]|nr:PP0621 family protein [Sideroxydans sp.]